MVNILDIEPEYFMVNDFKGCRDSSIVFILCYCEKNCVPHIVFTNIECIFRKCGIYSYLISCKNDKNKNLINSYVRIINQIEDEFEDDSFNLGKDFMRFRFRADDNLVSNQKIIVKFV